MSEDTAGTPRTDEEEFTACDDHHAAERCVSSDFARQLEREVAALTTQRDQLKKDLAVVRDVYKQMRMQFVYWKGRAMTLEEMREDEESRAEKQHGA